MLLQDVGGGLAELLIWLVQELLDAPAQEFLRSGARLLNPSAQLRYPLPGKGNGNGGHMEASFPGE